MSNYSARQIKFKNLLTREAVSVLLKSFRQKQSIKFKVELKNSLTTESHLQMEDFINSENMQHAAASGNWKILLQFCMEDN
jgi:hypothetical protein